MATVITKTIGPVGRDYASFTLAEAALVSIATAEFGSTDLVAENARIEFLADAGTYSEAVTFFSTLTTDATRNVTYKAAAGSEHGGSKNSGVIIEGTGSTYTLDVRDNYTAFDGLVISQQGGSYTAHAGGSTGFSFNACIFDGESTTTGPTFFRDTGGSASDRAVISNCVSIGSLTSNGNYFYTRVVAQNSYFRIINCTAIGSTLGAGFRLEGRSGLDIDAEIVNCLALCPRGYYGSFSPTVAGSNNFGGSTLVQLFPVALQGSPYPITVTTDVTAASTGSQTIYVSETGQLVDVDGNDITDQGIGPASNSDVPTTGIAGGTRSGTTTQPGAFATLKSLAPAPTPEPETPTETGGGTIAAATTLSVGDTSSLNTTWTDADGESRSRRYPTREGDVRSKIFKMTQAKSNISFIYRESLRSMIASFNDIGHFNAQDEFIDIKCIHGNAERAIAKLNQENSIILPMLSISQTISTNDDERRRHESVLVHEKYWDEKKGRAIRILSLAPRPVNISYQLNIWCKYMSDMDQILEQVRLKFNPEMNVPTEHSTLAKAFLESEDMVGSMTASTKEDRVLKKTMNIVLRTYIPSPKFLVTSTGEIEEFKIET